MGESKTRHLGRGHMPALDGVRGLAVLGVMATHLLAGDLTQIPVLPALLAVGVAGVDVFFVLSGFLITGILLDSVEDRFYFRRFYARRVLRIFPLYYGLMLLLIPIAYILHINWNGVQWSMLLYLQNTHFLFPSLLSFHTRFFSIDHLWSLAVEEQFYLVWPFVIALVRSRRWVLTICASGIVLALWLRIHCLQLGYGFDWINRNMLCRADQLLAGAALAVLMRSAYRDHLERLAKPLLLTAVAANLVQRAVAWWAYQHDRPFPSTAYLTSWNYTWTLLFAVGLIACCLHPVSRLRCFFEWKPLRSLGKYSYGLYVLHLVLLPGLTLLLLEPLRQLTNSKILPRLFIAVIGFCVSFVAAYASFHLYEKRFLRLKRYFDYDRRPAAASAA